MERKLLKVFLFWEFPIICFPFSILACVFLCFFPRISFSVMFAKDGACHSPDDDDDGDDDDHDDDDDDDDVVDDDDDDDSEEGDDGNRVTIRL